MKKLLIILFFVNSLICMGGEKNRKQLVLTEVVCKEYKKQQEEDEELKRDKKLQKKACRAVYEIVQLNNSDPNWWKKSVEFISEEEDYDPTKLTLDDIAGNGRLVDKNYE